jgi:hypothetical protein
MEHPSHCACPLRAVQSYAGRRRDERRLSFRPQARIGQEIRRLPQLLCSATNTRPFALA